MTREEVDNGIDEMDIDGGEPREGNAIPEGFNANYLKVYYGKKFGLSFASVTCYNLVIFFSNYRRGMIGFTIILLFLLHKKN